MPEPWRNSINAKSAHCQSLKDQSPKQLLTASGIVYSIAIVPTPSSARRILRKAGIDESIRFHDLRHTFTTMALSGGADPKTISGMLGHTSVDFTMNVYGYFTPQMQRDAAEKVGQVMEK